MNSSRTVCGNWNSYSPSIMSFVGLESNTQKQLWDWDTNSNTNNFHNNNDPFFIPTTSFIDFSSSTSALTNFPPSYPQITHYPATATGFLKREDGCLGVDERNCGNGRIGLNLGHRTYFSSGQTTVIDRLFKPSRGFYQVNQTPRCQVQGCNLDLINAKHYHRRHRVCEFHSKATKVLLSGGLEQRFCQQCSRFHALAEFDEVKRSCRKRLADHNRRRRKPHPGTASNSGAIKTAQNAAEKSQETGKRTRESSFPLLMTKDNKSSNQEKLQEQLEQKLVTQLQKGPALSLGGTGVVQRSSESQTTYTHQPFSSPSSFFARESLSPSLCMMNSHCCRNNISTGGGSVYPHQQQPEELQNLLQLGHAMFEVELL